ncbi:hypothetical protein Plhal304r1_c018g0065121 [Plasmopara halstedii]
MPLASKAVSIALDVSHNFLYTNVGMGAKEEDLLTFFYLLMLDLQEYQAMMLCVIFSP